MTEQETTPPLGSVAEEASRLMDALGSWAQSGAAGHQHEEPSAPRQPDPGAASADGVLTCEACGARTGVGRAESCRVCPVCQGIALLRSVRPETVERLADLAAVVASTLRELAVQRRDDDRPPAGDDGARSDRGRGDARAPVQDIDVSGTPDAPTTKEHGR